MQSRRLLATSAVCAATLAFLLGGFWVARWTGLGAGGPPYGFRATAFALVAAAFAVTHGWAWQGPRFALRFLAVAIATSVATETLGVATGLIFGHYVYAAAFGPKIFGLVPVVIPLIWFSMSYSAFLAASVILSRDLTLSAAGARRVVALSAGLLVGYDLVADPNHVFRGGWSYSGGGAFHGVPFQNFLAWYVIGLAMFSILRRLQPSVRVASVGIPSLIAIGSFVYVGILLHETAFAFLVAGLPGAGLVGLGLVSVTAFLLGRALRRTHPTNAGLAS